MTRLLHRGNGVLGLSEASSILTEPYPLSAAKDRIEDDKAQLKGKEKLQDKLSTARLTQVLEELQLPDSNVEQRTNVSMTPYSTPPEFPKWLIEDSSAKHGWASNSQEDISSPEKESFNTNNERASNNSSAIETSSDSGYSQDSQEDISSPGKESMNVSQFSQLESLPPKLYNLEIEACDALQSLHAVSNKLSNLQHLCITNCHLLKSIQVSHLPRALKTLDIRKCKEVEFLSTEQKHEFLEELYIDRSRDSLNSFPLAMFPQLRILCIWDCTNFKSLSITEDHMFLRTLEIGNCSQFISFPEEELRIPNLRTILLSSCKNLKVLPGQRHGITSLQSLIIKGCPEVESVPEGGLPSSLDLVCIHSCRKLTPCIEWRLHKLNAFSFIDIENASKDLESFPEQNLLPQNLINLRISRLSNLKVLDYKGLQHLTSLSTLNIISCDKLHSLPDKPLPSSLRYLSISGCPLLTSKLKKWSGEEYWKIGHIPNIQIEGKVIS